MMTKHAVYLAALALSALTLSAGEDLARHVDPFIGTKGTAHCYPNATTPFGLVQPGPASGTGEWAYTGGYQFEDPKLYGFHQTAISGTGCCDLGDLLVQPFTGPAVRADHYQFAKSAEKASPGYYAVTYPESGVTTEIAAAPHVAFYRFTFAKGGPAHVLLDLQWGIVGRGRLATHVLASDIDFPDDRTITGHNETSHWVRRDWYYTIAFDRAVKARTKLAPRDKREKGSRWVLDFDVQPGETILMKVALSSQSVAGAQANLAAEVPGWDFDAVRARARAQWNDLFARALASGTDEQKKTFYTSFYHLCISPNNISDVGAPRDFGTLSLWDTFRAAHPLYTILCPELVPDFITSMMTDYKKNGFLSIWTLWDKDNQCMIGTHSVPVLVDAYLKGFPADWEAVYAAIRDTLRNPHPNRRKENWDLLDQYGYYPFDKIKGESVSRTLECAYDDWCAAQMAAKLGKTEDAAFFAKRAQNWKNVFDASIGFVRGRDTHGKWRDPFDPFRLGHGAGTANDFTEGNAFQYSWHVMQDPDGLVAAYGGRDKFIAKLDSLFTAPDKVEGAGLVLDVTGLIGQYVHGNEPSHHVIYFYPLVGEPDKAADRIREVCDKFYRNAPDGLAGNDDCGQMSAWYMFSAMGFYPFNPCGGEYVIGAPQLPEVKLNLGGSRSCATATFTIRAHNLSAANKRVKSVTLNGKPLARPVIRHADILAGGTLVFEMGE